MVDIGLGRFTIQQFTMKQTQIRLIIMSKHPLWIEDARYMLIPVKIDTSIHAYTGYIMSKFQILNTSRMLASQ